MKNVKKLVAEAILKLEQLVKKAQGQLWLYGESICDIAFLEKSPLEYQLATDLSEEALCKVIGISIGSDLLKTRGFVLYYQGDCFHFLRDDFLPQLSKDRFQIEILANQADFPSGIKNKPFSIDRMFWDFQELHNVQDIENDFRNNAIAFSDETKNHLSKELLDLFRLARYVAKYNLNKTKAISPTIEKKSYKRFPDAQKWKSEFIKLFALSKPSLAFECLREWGILEYVFSELLEGYGVMQNEYHEYDVYYHILSACDAANPDEPEIRMAALFHDIGKPRSKKLLYKEEEQSEKNVFYDHENIGARMTYQILKKFGFSHKTVTQVSKLVRLHMFHYTSEWTDGAVRRLIKKADCELPNLFKLRKADRLGSGKKLGESKAIQRLETRIKQIVEYDNRTTVKDLEISGHDIMEAFNLSPGPIIGGIMNHLLNMILEDPEQNKKELLLSRVENWLKEKEAKAG